MFICFKCTTAIPDLLDIGSSGNKGVYCVKCTKRGDRKEKALIHRHIKKYGEKPTGLMLRYLRMIAWGSDQS